MSTRIITKLDREAVLNSLRDLLAERETFVGAVNHSQVSVAYRCLSMAPRLKTAAFLGRVMSAREGSVIEGIVESHTNAWLIGGVLLFGSITAVGREFIAQDYLALGAVFAIGTAMLVGWWRYVESTKKSIVHELCRASRGSVA